MGERIGVDPESLSALCQPHRISRLSLFGSPLKRYRLPRQRHRLLVELQAGTRTCVLRHMDLDGLLVEATQP